MPFFKLIIADILILLSMILLVYSSWLTVDYCCNPPIVVNIHNASLSPHKLELENVVNQALLKQPYFLTHLPSVSHALSKLELVRDARVVRQWPLSFSIFLEMEQPIAYWVDSNNAYNQSSPSSNLTHTLLINKYGETFYSKTAWHKKLPQLSAIPTNYPTYDKENQKVMAKRLEYWKSLTKQYYNDLSITRLKVTQGQMWNIEWNNRIWTNLGQHIEQEIKNIIQADAPIISKNIEHQNQTDLLNQRIIHFLASWTQLKKDYGASPLMIDLRYPNKMVVKPLQQHIDQKEGHDGT